MNQLSEIFYNRLKNVPMRRVPKAEVLLNEYFSHDFEYIDMGNTYDFTSDDITPSFSLV